MQYYKHATCNMQELLRNYYKHATCNMQELLRNIIKHATCNMQELLRNIISMQHAGAAAHAHRQQHAPRHRRNGAGPRDGAEAGERACISFVWLSDCSSAAGRRWFRPQWPLAVCRRIARPPLLGFVEYRRSWVSAGGGGGGGAQRDQTGAAMHRCSTRRHRGAHAALHFSALKLLHCAKRQRERTGRKLQHLRCRGCNGYNVTPALQGMQRLQCCNCAAADATATMLQLRCRGWAPTISSAPSISRRL